LTTHSTDWLFEQETIRFLKDNEEKNPESFLLSKALANKGWDTGLLVRQLKGIKTAKQKFPVFYNNPNILYPPAVSLEQASSEVTAKFKASIVRADRIIDLSGGMGIDTYFFSEQCKEMIYVEPQQELLNVAAHNFKALQAHFIQCIGATAEQFLEGYNETSDLIYIDPSRRKEGKRLADYKEWEPDIVGLKPQLWKVTNTILIKLSPMTDLSAVCKELGEVSEVFVVSDRNECKEVLVQLKQGFIGEPRVHAVLLHGVTKRQYSFYASEEQAASPLFSDPLNYLYEPDAALLKAGAFKKLAVDHNVKKIQAHTHLYTSEQLEDDFPGKIFQVESVKSYSKSNVSLLIEKEKDFHVLTRNATVTPEQVKKQFKLIERGHRYLIIFKSGNGTTFVARVLRLK
jgi:THUMP domain-like